MEAPRFKEGIKKGHEELELKLKCV